MDPVLEVKHLTKKFGSPPHEFIAVNDVSFSLKEGEIVGLLGPNGAGKTTTIHMMLGVMKPTEGDINYFGKSLYSHREEIMVRVNFSSSYIDLPWRLSVFENLDVMARLYSVKNRRERIEELLHIFGIGHLMNNRMGDLSSGQKTMVYLTKAFLNHPSILLLDEPTASLDPDIARKVRTFILEERDRHKTSMVFTSHNMAEVEEVCDRVIFINHGRIIAEDSPSRLARNVKLCEVKFIITDGMKRALNICEESDWKTKVEKRVITISVDQEEITHLLSFFAERKIIYSDLSIEKPTLEDYFIEATNDVKNKS